MRLVPSQHSTRVTVPTWTFREHVNDRDRPAFLFSFTDAPVMRALDLYREEAKAG